MNTPIQTALCAYGMSGKVFHAPFLHDHPGFHIKKVLQRTRSDVLERYPYVEIARTMDEILNDPEIELVVVNTPEPTHYDLASAVLEAGKHVIVEKAFTVTSAEAEDLIQLADEKNLLLSVYQNRRWDGDFLTTRKIVEEGLLGRLVEFESNYQRYRNFIQPETWKEEDTPGTGILYNLGSHLIDQVLFLFDWPEQVFADLRIQRTGGRVHDYFEVILYYPNFKATVKAGYLVREQGPRYKLLGTTGSFVKYGIDPQEEALKEEYLPSEPGWGEEDESNWGIINTTISGLDIRGKVQTLPGDYMAYYQNVHDAIRKKEPLAVTADQAKRVIEVIEAAYKSHKKGKIIEL
ncbi:MAG: Gfo/Idh/MocA family oxidoreductase [Bacteroidetes bacterium]|nr:Gfo/Idh/MocA family oxidoreductase [Bacteroidota bacterium]